MRRRTWQIIAIVGSVAAIVIAALLGGVSGVPEEQALDVRQPRIINGVSVSEQARGDRWRSMASLREAATRSGGRLVVGPHFCGGMVVAPRIVLTAAHCVIDGDGAPIRNTDVAVAVGLTSYPEFDDRSPGAQEKLVAASRRVERIAVHPSYDQLLMNNDVAAIFLAEDAAVEPTKVVGAGEDAIWGDGRGVPATPDNGPYIAGWGLTISPDRINEDNQAQAEPSDLQEVQFPIASDDACELSYAASGAGDFFSGTKVCGGTPDSLPGAETNAANACYGDSGGPLVAKAGSEWRLLGVTSHGGRGMSCGDEFHGVYTRLAGVRRWLGSIGVGIGDGQVQGPAPDISDGDESVLLAGASLVQPLAGKSFRRVSPDGALSWSLPTGYTTKYVRIRPVAVNSEKYSLKLSTGGTSIPASELKEVPAGTYFWYVVAKRDSDGRTFATRWSWFNVVGQHRLRILKASIQGQKLRIKYMYSTDAPDANVVFKVSNGRRLLHTSRPDDLAWSVDRKQEKRTYSANIKKALKVGDRIRITASVNGGNSSFTVRWSARKK